MNQPKNWWKTIEIRNLGTTEGEDILLKIVKTIMFVMFIILNTLFKMFSKIFNVILKFYILVKMILKIYKNQNFKINKDLLKFNNLKILIIFY